MKRNKVKDFAAVHLMVTGVAVPLGTVMFQIMSLVK